MWSYVVISLFPSISLCTFSEYNHVTWLKTKFINYFVFIVFLDHPTLSSGPPVTDKSGTVNPLESFCSVVRTRLSNHSLVMVGEVDCCEHVSSY